MTPETFRDWLLSDGMTTDVRLFPEAGIYTATRRLLFHYTLILGQIGDETGYDDRWCFADRDGAVAAMNAWDASAGGEPEGWRRHPASGRRRPGGDPAGEFVAR